MLTKNNLNAFTFIELMVVVIIIAIIAGFAIPNYQTAVERAYERDAIANLATLHGANQIYRAQNNVYWPPSGSSTFVAINTALGLSLFQNGLTYTIGGDGTTFTATARRWGPAAGFTVTVTQAILSATNPQCTSGTCP